jgi:hypothetical protein
MLTLKTREDLQRLVDEGLEESLVLDYKSSPSLARESKRIDELCKDVSAMANSAGGQIIYGIKEDKKTHKPCLIDTGVSDPKLTREWIEQIILSKVQPRIQKLSIERIPLDKTKTHSAFVLAVEPTTIGAHQAPDKKYYKRFELSSVPMEDYEIRDISRRAVTPDLFITLSLPQGNTAPVEPLYGQDHSKPVPLIARIANRSIAPAYYTIVTIGLDTSLIVTSDPAFNNIGTFTEPDGHRLNFFRYQIGIPSSFPIFREATMPLEPTPRRLAVAARSRGRARGVSPHDRPRSELCSGPYRNGDWH